MHWCSTKAISLLHEADRGLPYFSSSANTVTMQLLKTQSAALGLSTRVKSINRRMVVKVGQRTCRDRHCYLEPLCPHVTRFTLAQAVDTETPAATQAKTDAPDSINKLPQPDW